MHAGSPSPTARPGSRAENAVVYATGLVQGIVLVTFPAASSVFTARSGFGLSTTQYGLMFLPQVIAAIAAALLGGRLISRFGGKRALLAGLAAALVSMLLLAGGQLVESNQSTAYPLLLVATASLGVGFGLTVPTLTIFVGAFHPQAVDRSTLALNALLGLGTALAPAFVAIFVGLGFWWGLPILSSILVAAIFLVARRLPFRTPGDTRTGTPARRRSLPARFWIYATAAMLYGVVETMSGNWSRLLMIGDLRATAVTASLALTGFWAMVTIGRIAFAALQRVIPSRWIYRLIPLPVAAAYLWLLLLTPASPLAAILAFALAGLGCSALLPLTVSLAEREFAPVPSGAVGRLIAFYQVGYGIAAFGVGPLIAAGATLTSSFGIAAAVAVLFAVVALVITRSPRRANRASRTGPRS